MKILKQEKNGNKHKFEIETDFDSFKEARDEVVASYAKELKVPGFRPGKAPKSIVEKNLDSAAINDRSAQHLISKLYPELQKEHKIDPVDYPNIEIIEFEEGKPLKFSLEVETYPEVKLGKYKGIKIKKKSTETTEKELLNFLGNLQNRFAKHIDAPNGIAQKEDLIDLEIQAEAEGTQIKRWPRLLERFPLGEGHISQDFDKNVIGMKVSEEKELKILFPHDYNIQEIAGKEVSFKIKINKIHRKELLPLDDEFAKTVSNFGTLSEFKEELRKNLELEKREEADADLKNQIIELVSSDSKTDIPPAMVRIEIDLMVDELKTSLARSNLTLDDYLKSVKKSEDDLRAELKIPSVSRAKGKVVLKKVAEIENLTVAPHDVDTEIALIAQSSNQSVEEYKKSLGEGGTAYIKDYILRRKALDFLINQARIES